MITSTTNVARWGSAALALLLLAGCKGEQAADDQLVALARRQGLFSSLSHFSLGEAEILPEEPQAWSLDAETFPAARELEVRASPPIDFLSVRRFG